MTVVLYFASLREALGSKEEIGFPGPLSLTDLVALLQTRSAAHARTLGDLSTIRAAINAEFAPWDAIVAPGDEVALFPPVTGGGHV